MKSFLGLVAVLASFLSGSHRSSADEQDLPLAAGIPSLPARRPADAPPAGPPTLPPNAESVLPVTLEVLIRRQPHGGPPTVLAQTIGRTAERIHVAIRGGGEWLFQRNPRDPRRVMGFAIDHSQRVILEYEESDLRNHLGIRGWADALTLGFDRSLLDWLRPTSAVRTIEGIRFARYVPGRNAGPLREVWWSDEQALAASFRAADGTGSMDFKIERVRAGVNPEVVRPPAERFPSYRLVHLADWLERE